MRRQMGCGEDSIFVGIAPPKNDDILHDDIMTIIPCRVDICDSREGT